MTSEQRDATRIFDQDAWRAFAEDFAGKWRVARDAYWRGLENAEPDEAA
jgi:hypothetical protein